MSLVEVIRLAFKFKFNMDAIAKNKLTVIAVQILTTNEDNSGNLRKIRLLVMCAQPTLCSVFSSNINC